MHSVLIYSVVLLIFLSFLELELLALGLMRVMMPAVHERVCFIGRASRAVRLQSPQTTETGRGGAAALSDVGRELR